MIVYFSTMYCVSQQQIHDFLENTLKLSPDIIRNRHGDKLHFLTSFCTTYDCHIPLQNLTTTCVPFPERKQPTLQEDIEAVFSQHGGRCWTLNSVMYILLKELGFDAKSIISSVYEEGGNNHIMILVENVEHQGDKYLVDVGFGGQSHGPISLDFETVSPIYKAAHQTTRWVKKGDTYTRQDLLDPVIGIKIKHTDGDWGIIASFTLEEKSLEWIRKSMYESGYSRRAHFFNVTLQITGTNKDLKKFVAILNDKLLIEGGDGKLQKSVLKTDGDVLAAVKTYFPVFPSEIVAQSYKIWHQFDKDVKPVTST